jgi:STE24 endopeptidase
MFIAKAFMVPLEAYEMEIIDKKHKMVTKTLYDYIYDLFVEGILTLLVISPIIYGYLRLVSIGGKYYFIFLQIFILVITVILAQVYPNFIAPYFNRFSTIQDEDVKFKIRNLAAKTGFPLGEIKVKV